MMDVEEKCWHLAWSKPQGEVTEFELQLWRVFYGFLRWQDECEKSANDTDLNGHEIAILHVVRMKEKPKTITDIGRILNRNDMFNINYILRKLLRKGLVKKSRTSQGNKTFVYEVTKKGIENTDAFAAMKRHVLIGLFTQNETLALKEMARDMMKIKSIYDEADSILAYTTVPKIL